MNGMDTFTRADNVTTGSTDAVIIITSKPCS